MRRRPADATVRAGYIVLCLSTGGVLALGVGAGCSADDEVFSGADATSDGAGDADMDASVVDTGPQRAEFGLDTRPPNPTCRAPARPPPAAPVTFEPYQPSLPFAGAMVMAQPPNDPTRFLVGFRDGRFAAFAKSAATEMTPIGNVGTIAGVPVNTEGEHGLLGFAFHPSFAQNGRIYVSWVTGDGVAPRTYRSRIGYLTTTNGGTTFTSYTNILSFDSAATNHKGGTVAFGRDGFLYASFGDAVDVFQGQDPNLVLSKVIRIDVDGPPAAGRAYGIPADNPFATSASGEPATFALGFRNPFRFSFDRDTGDLWLGDVGQNRWEEINLVKKGGNYGWSCMEGNEDFWKDLKPTYCPNGLAGLVPPIIAIEHVPNVSAFRSITGGVVYRGKAIPSFVGTYVFGDFATKELDALRLDAATGTPVMSVINPNGPAGSWVSFAEDLDGEVYAIDLGGAVYKMTAAPGGQPSSFPDRLSKTGCVDPASKKPVAGAVPFAVNAELWSDGAEKARWMGLPDGKTITVAADGDFDVPAGSVLMKTFKLAGKRIETRLLVRHDDGGWAGYTYEWLDDESDAVLLASSKRKKVGAVDWYFPSRGECMHCHTTAAGVSLGLELGQLNGELLYEATNRISNQLTTLEHIGVFTAPIGAASTLPVIPKVDGSAPLVDRARGYLHANCAMCHRPQGGGRGPMDLRYATSDVATKTCGVDAETGTQGIAGAKLIVPGDPTKSLVTIRARAVGAARMPPLASSVVDVQGLDVVDAWIKSINSCP